MFSVCVVIRYLVCVRCARACACARVYVRARVQGWYYIYDTNQCARCVTEFTRNKVNNIFWITIHIVEYMVLNEMVVWDDVLKWIVRFLILDYFLIGYLIMINLIEFSICQMK